jgi:hypothetical protein
MLFTGLAALPWSLALIIFPPMGDVVTWIVLWVCIAMNCALLAYMCWGTRRRKSPDIIGGLRAWREFRGRSE